MKENRWDTILAYGVDGMNGVFDFIDREWGAVKPFNTELSKPVDILYTYEQLMLPENQPRIQELIAIHGIGAWIGYEKKALTSKKARGL